MRNNLAATVIPIYKAQPDANEIGSLNQCLRVLKKHPLIFIGPAGLDTGVYQTVCSRYEILFNYLEFEDHYFADIIGYNQLMLSPFFYKIFLQYKFILIYQLDAYVFKDELEYWCRQNYDFIGAPAIPHENQPNEIQFLKGYTKILKIFNKVFKTSRKISNVGNGGFSLRKTKVCYRLLRLLPKKIRRWGTNNEDGFFKYWGNIAYPLFRLPADDTALRFSIEEFPAASLKKLGNVLPFGCHGFEKYEPETWRAYIGNRNERFETASEGED